MDKTTQIAALIDKAANTPDPIHALQFSQAACNAANACSSVNLNAPPEPSAQQIKDMVERFLAWRLPDDFHPDAGISFEREFNAEYNALRGHPKQFHTPSGTNLFDYTQAEQMVRHMLDLT